MKRLAFVDPWRLLRAWLIFGAACSANDAATASRGTGTKGNAGNGGLIGASDAGGFAEDGSATQLTDGPGIVQAPPDVAAGACADKAAVAGPYPRKCAAPTDDECGGGADVNPALPNGSYGNGFDDDCDGKVDEGCACDPGHPVGTTRVCSLASSSQVDPATKLPVGWCRKNSVGTIKCVSTGKEFGNALWDPECRGAQPPFGDDVCARGDFDCDGAELNSRTRDCSCKTDLTCPSEPIVTQPFPAMNNLLEIDGASWTADPGGAKNWKWTVTGGDCDNILPHPTFAVYSGKDIPGGAQRISSDTPQQNLGINGAQHGFVVGPAGTVGPKIYPAFALSGDYLVQGEWDDAGGHHSCTLKVQVRAPGIRAELCWSPMPNDLDLHLARLQNKSCKTHGWFSTCSAEENGDDCYYLSACAGSFTTNPSPWGYPESPATSCLGWGSARTVDTCDNPRLDQDNVTCDPTVADPLAQLDPLYDGGSFCTPENINVDNPHNGDKFALGVQYYGADDSDHPGPVRPHVNVYCNGVRKLAFGLDPALTGTNDFPVLTVPGEDNGGDMWEVATIEAKVDGAGTLTDCIITPIHSAKPKPTKDGSRDLCVDTHPQNGNQAAADDTHWNFSPTGGYPAVVDGFCWH